MRADDATGLPVFETRRLLLRPRVLADIENCLAMDRDAEVVRFVTGPWSDAEAHRAFIEARTRGPYPPGLGYWTICRRDDPAGFVGWVLLIPADAVGPEIEIGWRLRREAWGQGFATEAARPVLAYGLTALNLTGVTAEIDPDNIGSLRVAEKLGLRRVGLVQHWGKPALRFALKRGEARFDPACP